MIRQMKDSNIATIHIVGIGDRVNFNVIRCLAIEGGGEYLFVKNIKQMNKQMIQLLESIASSEVKKFHIKYNRQKTLESSYPPLPKVLKKGR
jgi:hypothetical protein